MLKGLEMLGSSRDSPSEGGDDARADGARPDAEIGSEAPIRTSSQDRLRRVDFADRIATVLSELSLAEGRVFAIRGGWGYGKSSLKHLVMERLDARKNGASWLDFNPWQWGDSDAIARALFGEIANKLGGDYSEGAAQRAAKFRKYGAILTGSAEPLVKASGNAQLLSSVLTSAAVAAVASAVGFSMPAVATVAAGIAITAAVLPLIGKVLAYWGRDRTAEPLDAIRRSLEASLKKLPRPLVIFVDDIDRLEPDQIRLLLRQVKANANLPNLVFVLIFQPSIVEAALNPIAGGNGAAFLEKIVQTNFDLPAVPSTAVHRVFTEQLSEMARVHATEENGFQQVRWGNSLIGCIQPYLRNLRDARRLISSIAVHLPLHTGSDTFEVNIVDFLMLETLRVFEPDLHGLLFRQKDLVLQTHRSRGGGRDDIEKNRIRGLLDVVSSDRRDVTMEMLKDLFPQIAWGYDGLNYDPSWSQKWTSEKRVCSLRFFTRYFELQTPDGEISESDFISFLASSSDIGKMSGMLAEIEDRGLLPALAQRLDESVNRLPVANAAILLPAMFNLGEKLANTGGIGMFNSPWISAWRAIDWFLRRTPVEHRHDLAIGSLRTTGSLSVGGILIHLNDTNDQREGERNNLDPALDNDTVKAMKEECLRQIVALSNAPEQMLSRPDLLNLLYRWRDYTGTLDASRGWITKIIDTDARFASFVTRMMSRGTSSGLGDRVATAYDFFDRQTVQDFIGIKEALARIEAIDVDALNADEAHATRVLRRHLENWNDEAAEDGPA